MIDTDFRFLDIGREGRICIFAFLISHLALRFSTFFETITHALIFLHILQSMRQWKFLHSAIDNRNKRTQNGNLLEPNYGCPTLRMVERSLFPSTLFPLPNPFSISLSGLSRNSATELSMPRMKPSRRSGYVETVSS